MSTDRRRREMKKIKLGLGAAIMIAAMIISDRAEIFVIYAISALLHELGHITAAKLMKIEIKEIKFDFSGVRICTDEKLTSYKRELVLAAAGPLVNFAVIMIILTCFKMNGASVYEVTESINQFWENGSFTTYGAAGFFALCSLLQGGINLLPVNTFDGGRILYCAIAQTCGERAASRVISVSSAAAAFVLWTVSLYLMLKISAGLGIYVFAACIFFTTLKGTEWE